MFKDLITDIVIEAMILKGYMDVKRMHRNTNDALKKNEALLFKILKINQDTEYGKKYNFRNIKTIEDFRKSVPITHFSDYEPYVKRMIDNDEMNLLTALPVVGYAQSSGSVGARKFIPLTQYQINTYTNNTITRTLALTDKYYKEHHLKMFKRGRGSSTCVAFNDFLPNGLLCSNVADVAARQLGFLYPYILNVPFAGFFDIADIDSRYANLRFALEDRNMMYIFSAFFMNISDLIGYLKLYWKIFVEDIRNGTISDIANIKESVRDKFMNSIKPNPQRADELQKEFEKGFDETILKRIWPNLAVISGIGTSSFAPFAKKIRTMAKDIPFDYSIYGASEGLFAACDELESEKQLILVDSCYYEFIPVDNPDKILSLNELEVGNEYEIVITNNSGLYRYRCGDVIKVVDYLNDCPYIVFSHRIGQLLNLTGEKTTEEHMQAVVNELAKIAGCTIDNWVVYNNIDDQPCHYVLMLENKEGKDLTVYQEKANEILSEKNPRFGIVLFSGVYGKMTLQNLKFGAQEEWRKKMIASGTVPEQVKPVRILDNEAKEKFFLDRLI